MSEFSKHSFINRPHIHIFLGDIASKGGIERVSVNLANALSSLYPVRLISLYCSTKEMSFLPGKAVSIDIIHNGFEESMYNRSKSLFSGMLFDISYINRKSKELKQRLLIDKNTIAICCDVKMALLAKRAGYKKIIAIEHFEYDVINPILKKIRKLLYKKINALVTLTSEDKDKYAWLSNRQHKIIPNIVDVPEKISDFSLRDNTVLAVGRLTSQKGFDLLLKAWRKIDSSNWILKIIGDGEDRELLLSFINENNMTNVKLLPFTKKIHDEYNHAKIFVLSSRYEGFGMVLVEALAFGMACISYDCPAGPKTILNNNNGILVEAENVEHLAQALEKLMKDEALQRTYSEISPSSIHNYTEGKVLSEWDMLIKQVANESL